eukprot:Skav228152  [mRNA]  locus=scaffold2683:300867:301331:- [translate_table: standard]
MGESLELTAMNKNKLIVISNSLVVLRICISVDGAFGGGMAMLQLAHGPSYLKGEHDGNVHFLVQKTAQVLGYVPLGSENKFSPGQTTGTRANAAPAQMVACTLYNLIHFVVTRKYPYQPSSSSSAKRKGRGKKGKSQSELKEEPEDCPRDSLAW